MGKKGKRPGLDVTDAELRARWRDVAGNVLGVTEQEAAELVAGGIFTASSPELSMARILAYRVGVTVGAQRVRGSALAPGELVTAYPSERDNALVVDVDAPAHTRVRVNVNDGLVAELVVPE